MNVAYVFTVINDADGLERVVYAESASSKMKNDQKTAADAIKRWLESNDPDNMPDEDGLDKLAYLMRKEGAAWHWGAGKSCFCLTELVG